MPTKKIVPQEPFRKVHFKGKYHEFSDFYDIHKKDIFSHILELFKEFKTTRKKTLVITFSALIQGLDWSTEFKFRKDDTIVLKRDLIPIFEDFEDYETCQEINKLYKELTFKK